MIRHISVFTLKDKNQIDSFIEMLNECGEKCPLIVNSQVGKNITPPLPEGIPGPHFGDIIQIIDFQSLEDNLAYPQSSQHMHLLNDGPEMIEVTAIDFEF